MKSSPQKVLYLVDSLTRGGTERNVVELCKHLDRKRYTPKVLTLRADGAYRSDVEAAGVEIDSVWKSGRGVFSLARHIAKGEGDLVHAWHPASAICAYVARFLYGSRRPLIVSHGTTDVVHYVRADRSLRTAFKRFAYRIVLRLSGCRIFANSESVRRTITNMGVEATRVGIIPNGHDVSRFHKAADLKALRKQLGFSQTDRVAIFVGRLVPSKRIGDLIQAVAIAQDEHPNLRLMIVGEGAERDKLEEITQSLELSSKIRFVGERTDVPELLRMSDIFVSASELEGLANAVIEASLAELPIVACEIGGVCDVVCHRQEALLVRPRAPKEFAKALSSLLNNETRAKELGRAARIRAEQRFDMNLVVEQVQESYDKLCAS